MITVKAGDEFASAASGERYRFIQTGTETSGALAKMEDVLPAGVPGPPAHVHPRQAERFVVRSGLLGVRIDGRDQTLRPGDAVTVAPGSSHAIWNAGEGDFSLTVEMRPALRFPEFLATAAALSQRRAGGRFTLLEGGLLMERFGGEIRPTQPPLPLQRILFPFLAALARRLGQRLPENVGSDQEARPPVATATTTDQASPPAYPSG